MNNKICGKCNSSNPASNKFCEKCGSNLDSASTSTTTVASKPAKNNKAISIAGFVCSLVGLLSCGLTSLVGLILSIVGLSSSKKRGEKDGLALAGIIISAISLVIIFIVIIGLVASYSSSKEITAPAPSTSPAPTTKQKNNEKYSLIESNISSESNEFSTYIEGRIKNNQNKELSYIQVTFSIYDADGNTIGTCIDNQNTLDAYGTWKFKAICIEDVSNVSRYELKEITGW